MKIGVYANVLYRIGFVHTEAAFQGCKNNNFLKRVPECISLKMLFVWMPNTLLSENLLLLFLSLFSGFVWVLCGCTYVLKECHLYEKRPLLRVDGA